MTLVTRTGKGSKLTIEEMDNNLLFLQSLTEVIDVTYDEIRELKEDGHLIPNRYYRITNYKTAHNILDGDSNITGDVHFGNLEPFIVYALGVDKLHHQAYSELFPQDIIYYDITGGDVRDIAFFNTGEEIEGLKGIIYFRKDTIQNVQLGYDFRNVKFRRWLVDAVEWVSGAPYLAKAVVNFEGLLYKCIQNVTDTTGPDSDIEHWIRWLDLDYKYSHTSTEGDFLPGDINSANLIISNDRSNYEDYYTFWDQYHEVKNCYFEVFPLSMYIEYGYNSILTNNVFILDYPMCYNNTFKSLTYCNTFKECETNEVSGIFIYNVVDYEFDKNKIINAYRNIIGPYFFTNYIKISNFNQNVIRSSFGTNNIEIGEFRFNNIRPYFQYNNISVAQFNSNIIESYFQNNNIKCLYFNSKNLLEATHVYEDYYCEIANGASNTLWLRYYDNLGAIQIVLPTA